MLKFFAVLSSILKRSNYFDGPTKLFSDLYLDKFFFWDSSTRLFLSCW